MRWLKRRNSWVAEVHGGIVGWMSGGVPADGCDLVSVLIFAPTEDAVRNRADEIGLWSAYEMDVFGEPDPKGVRAAVADPEQFVRNHADGGEWLPSSALKRA